MATFKCKRCEAKQTTYDDKAPTNLSCRSSIRGAKWSCMG